MNPKIQTTIGAVLLTAGAALFFSGLPEFHWKKPFSYAKQTELKSGDAGFPKLESHYPVDKLSTYAIERENASPLSLQVADYSLPSGQTRKVTLFLSSEPVATPTRLRNELWSAASKAIASHAGPHAIFLTWWDNAQRLDLLTGVETWSLLPDPQAWQDQHERAFWQEISGGKDESQRSVQMARWLTLEADQAIREMSEQLPKDRDIYWLVSLDDLARLKEIETLTHTQLPMETQLFAAGGNFHNLIAQVKRWAKADETEANYLLQQIPNYGVRAWRITDPKANDWLISRMLPFTGSLNRLPEGMQLVYQSEQAYLSVYRLNFNRKPN